MKPQTRISRIDSYLEEMNNKGFTTQPVALGNCTDVMPEFGRFQDVQRLFRLKRPTVYNLIAEGQIKSVSLAMVVKNMCGIFMRMFLEIIGEALKELVLYFHQRIFLLPILLSTFCLKQ